MTTRKVLYIIVCATPAASRVGILIGQAQDSGWMVCVISTPSALRFIDQSAIEKQTGHPVRYDYKIPGDADILPSADAIIVAGASFNTLNKWANGISDTLALGLITEAIGLSTPTVALPFLNSAQAAHPSFDQNIRRLQDSGVIVLLGSNGYEPHKPKAGLQNLASYPWHLALSALAAQSH